MLADRHTRGETFFHVQKAYLEYSTANDAVDGPALLYSVCMSPPGSNRVGVKAAFGPHSEGTALCMKLSKVSELAC